MKNCLFFSLEYRTSNCVYNYVMLFQFSILFYYLCFLVSHSLCAVRNNYETRHLAKILIHLGWCLQECISTSGAPSVVYRKALNALYLSSIFLKYLIENAKTDKIEELFLSLDEREPVPADVTQGNLLVLQQLLGCIWYLYYSMFFDWRIPLACIELENFRI